ncbi:hypothetical protein [Geofilum rubicundum]|uniref:Oligosaccharide repeat unit polymerase Wzy n=1 Tax=Geofilum rubicundum JCM 15548 TaxID=1236989 RepID=A0A0E9M1V9_9BACT|nr:hypothetical protein [Geofilum rubicundum]GAO31479.1 hypothetical protein JCM15548_13843 [Geofilum rubicundum JCM 15548]
MKIQLSTVNILAVFIFCLSSFYFYEPFFFNDAILKVFYWFMLAIIFAFSFKYFLYTSEPYVFAASMRMLLLSMFISTLPALLFWGQSPVLTLRAMFPHLGFVLYFFLIATKPSFKSMVSLVWVLACLYVIVYLFSLTKAPDVIFGSFADRGIGDQRGLFRLFIPGRGFLFLSFFLAISNYVCTKRSIWLWISIGLFLIIVAHVIRQYIFFSFFIAGFVLIRKVSIWKKITFLLFGVVLSVYIYEYSSVIQALFSLTELQVSGGQQTEDIRVTAYSYFFTEFSPGLFSVIFGNGVPHEHSSYGYFYTQIVNDQMRLFMSDVGYAQIFAQFGLLGLVAVGVILFKSIFVKIPSKYLYLKLFLIFVFLSNVMSGYFLSNHNIAAICIVLYMFEVSSQAQLISKKATI